jgi:anti-sigma B factor antagonist
MEPAEPPFEIEVLESPSGARLFRLHGALTIKTLFDFQGVVRQERTRPIIVDLSGVEYMDSAGMGSIITVYTSCQNGGRGFAITGSNDRIQTLFEVTKVDGLLPCFETLADADKAVGSPPIV